MSEGNIAQKNLTLSDQRKEESVLIISIIMVIVSIYMMRQAIPNIIADKGGVWYLNGAIWFVSAWAWLFNVLVRLV